jgi:hypothetical protein
MELIQRKLFSRQEFKFDNTTLHLSTWSLITGLKSWSLKLDEIGHRKDVRQMGLFSNGCLFSVAVIILSTLVIIQLPLLTTLIVLAIAFTPMIIGRFTNHYNYIQLHTRRGPVFIGYSKKEKERVDTFLSGLREASKKFMLWKYGTVDVDIPQEKLMENFWWLRNNEIITEEEYLQLKTKLKDTLAKK